LKAQHVLARLQAMHGGADYDSRWGQRQRGSGEYATLLAQRFQLACKRLGLNSAQPFVHDTSLFSPLCTTPQQLALI
jgi:hypothetical protein